MIKIHSHLERIETSSQFAQIVDVNEPVALVTMNVKVGGNVGIISICLPHMSIEPVAKQLNTRSWYSGAQVRKVTPAKETVSRRILDTEVTIGTFFNNTTATVEEIAGLKAGDVIVLEHKVGDPVNVMLQNIPKFRASIGTKGSKYAVKIQEILKGKKRMANLSQEEIDNLLNNRPSGEESAEQPETGETDEIEERAPGEMGPEPEMQDKCDEYLSAQEKIFSARSETSAWALPPQPCMHCWDIGSR